MASRNRGEAGSNDPKPSGATEPLTLTDPDGAVTRVAPWSSWTREQVRAPGGEPALVTRLDQGQLWFSAGRRRSPWRHEVHVGPAVVSTPRGRFQATAEADGGATVACLAGRTRVVAGLREPVLLGPDQSAAVSADGRTLVVMDRATNTPLADDEVIDLTDAAREQDAIEGGRREAGELAAVGAAGAAATVGAPPTEPADPPAVGADGRSAPVDGDGELGSVPPEEMDGSRRPARLGWIPEVLAVAALVAVLVAVVWVFWRDTGSEVASPDTTAPITEAPTTEAPTTTEATTTTEVPTTTTTEAPPPSATGATASGVLTGCSRAEGGVSVSVDVTHQSGPASMFTVSAALVDAEGTQFASGQADTEVIDPSGTTTVDVLVPFVGEVSGACELVGVVSG